MTLQELMALSQDPRVGEIRQTPERSYLRGLGQPDVPAGTEVLGPSESFQNDPAYQPDQGVTDAGAMSRLAGLGGGEEGEKRSAGLDWAAILMQLGSAVAAAIAASKQKRQKTLIAVS